MAPEEKRDIFSRLNEHKKKVAELRASLNEIDRQKEDWFEKKEGYNRQIKGLIRKIKDDKGKRDSFTKQVKEDKEVRTKLNDDVKSKISEIKELSKKKRELADKHNIKERPYRIKEEIERLELRIETDVMSFEREKELMKRIKELKKKLGFSEEVSRVFEKIDNLSGYIGNVKSDAEETHKRIQDRAKESQAKHKEIIDISREIDKLKDMEKNAFGRFTELKKRFNEVNEELKKSLLEMSAIKGEVDGYMLDTKRKKEESEHRILKSKEELLQDKIKRGEKLTTEDLLIFQKN